jgi:hypothetical protein
MPKKPYMPQTSEGIDAMLDAFDTNFTVEEPLPASGTAEIWIFEAQYRYQNQPFGQVSQPLNLTVRG